jgi:hypothetical protein
MTPVAQRMAMGICDTTVECTVRMPAGVFIASSGCGILHFVQDDKMWFQDDKGVVQDDKGVVQDEKGGFRIDKARFGTTRRGSGWMREYGGSRMTRHN